MRALQPWQRIARPVLVLVTTVLVVASCSSGHASSAGGSGDDASATLQVLSTDVTVQPDGAAAPSAGTSGESMSVGDTVRTDPAGFAEIGFFDGSLTRVDHSAEFTIVDLQNPEASKVVHTDLAAGRSWNRIEKLSESQTWQLDTPVASATVRGTAFVADCSIATPNACQFTVAEGTVELRRPDATIVTLHAGEQITLVEDQPPPSATTIGVATILSDPWVARNVALDSAAGRPAIEQAAGPIDGTFTVSGTMTCEALGGGQGPGTAPIPAGSSFTVQGDQVTITGFLDPPQKVLRVVSPDDPFHITATYTNDSSGGFTTVVPAGTPASSTFTIDFTGTTSDGGSTITGTGSDTGVNCGYTFTATKATATTVSDGCQALDAPHLDPALGELHNTHACDGTWAVAYFVSPSGSQDVLLIHWNGTRWERADPTTYCALPPPSIPNGPVTEDDQAARVYIEECRSPQQSTTTVPSPGPDPIDASCDQASLEAAVRALHPDANPTMTVLACRDSWGVVEYGVGDTGDVNAVLTWDGQAWQPAGAGVCDRTDLPQAVHYYACMTN